MSITTSIVFDNEQERDYIKRLIKVRRNLIGLVENGALSSLPDMIELAMAAIKGSQSTPQESVPTGVAINEPQLPPFVEDILNGGAYPNMEDCTHEEAAILYNKTFQSLFKAYVSARDDKVRLSVKQQIEETVKSICLTLR